MAVYTLWFYLIVAISLYYISGWFKTKNFTNKIMRVCYEGQTLNLEKEFSFSRNDNEDYHFIEIKANKLIFLYKTPHYYVKYDSTGEMVQNREERLLIIKYYQIKRLKVEDNDNRGIKMYDEFKDFEWEESNLLETVIFRVLKPCNYQIFIKNQFKYLAVQSIFEDYEILIEKGNLIKEGPFYKILGSGCFIYRAKDIILQLG